MDASGRLPRVPRSLPALANETLGGVCSAWAQEQALRSLCELSKGEMRGTSNPPQTASDRFVSCRWRARPADGAFCTHCDVRPYAGTSGFKPAAWCEDCPFYKVRRPGRPRSRSRFTRWAPLGLGLGWSESPAPQALGDDGRVGTAGIRQTQDHLSDEELSRVQLSPPSAADQIEPLPLWRKFSRNRRARPFTFDEANDYGEERS